MKLEKQITTFSLEWFHTTLKEKGISGLMPFVEFLFDKVFTVADTGIDRRDIHLWNKDNFIPFNQEQGWDKFNFVDVLWLHLLAEFKNLGLSRKIIEKIKEHFFTISKNVQSELEEKLKTDETTQSTLSKNSSQEFEELLKSAGLGMLAVYTIISIIHRKRYILIVDAKEDLEIADLDFILENTFDLLPIFFGILSSSTSRIVNLSSIIERISNASGLFSVKDQELVVRESATAIIKRLFRDNNVKEISIRLTNKDELILKVTEQLSYHQLNQKINSLQRKGQFVDLQIKTRDGQIQLFVAERLIKL